MDKEFDIREAIHQLGVLLIDETTGLIHNTLKKNFDEEYKDFDTISAWECFVEEVNRVNTVCELHDFLVDIRKEDWKALLEKMDNGDVE